MAAAGLESGRRSSMARPANPIAYMAVVLAHEASGPSHRNMVRSQHSEHGPPPIGQIAPITAIVEAKKYRSFYARVERVLAKIPAGFRDLHRACRQSQTGPGEIRASPASLVVFRIA